MTPRTIRGLRKLIGSLAAALLVWSITGDLRVGALTLVVLGYADDLALTVGEP